MITNPLVLIVGLDLDASDILHPLLGQKAVIQMERI